MKVGHKLLLLLTSALVWTHGLAAEVRPNIVLIFLDDSGWSDFHPFGNPPYPTPNVERLAAEGGRYNNFFVPQAVCSASRAALLTGCYPERTKVFGATYPGERGLEPRFPVLSEVLQKNGYATGIFGKWHIGDHPDTRPAARGFGESAGMMYSNDMWDQNERFMAKYSQFPLQYWTNGQVTDARVTPELQKNMTQRLTDSSVQFIERHKAGPFFLYVPYFMPHVPLFCSDAFAGKSGAGLYGDVIMELDHSIGRLMEALKTSGVEKNTVVIFTSDNGPYSIYGNHAGTTPFRESKITSFNGGTQSALLIKYPAQIKAGTVSNATFCSVDLLPTLCALSGTALPSNEIDGRNVWPLITGAAGATNPHAYYPVTLMDKLEAVMSGDGRWKLHLPHRYRQTVIPGVDGNQGTIETLKLELSLFDLHADPGETSNVIAQNPEVAARLKQWAAQHTETFFK